MKRTLWLAGWRDVALDGLFLAALLVLAAATFGDAVRQPGSIVAGMDLTQHYSREAVMRIALHDTWVPLWNPYEFSGFPEQADPQTGVFYPPSMVLRLFPIASFLTWTVVFHVWMFGAGGYLLCRTIGVGRLASVAAGTGLMLGGITMGRVYSGHFDVLRTVAWVPLALAMAIRSIDRQRIRPTAAAVIALSLEILGSFLQLACYTFLAIAAYAAFSAIWPRTGERSRRLLRITAVHFMLLVVLVFGVAAFQILPTARLIQAAGRTGGMSFNDAIQSAVDPGQLWQTVFAATPPNPIPAESWERSAYIGWLLPALAPLALFMPRQRRAVSFFVLLGGAALVLATGGPLYRLHYLLLPMFRIPGRFVCFWSISVAVLGAIALDGLTKWRGWRRIHADREAADSRVSPGLVIPLIASFVIAWDVSAYARHFVRAQPLDDRFQMSVPFTPSPHGRVVTMCESRIQTSELTALGLASIDGYNSYFLADYGRFSELARGEQPSQQLKAFPRMGESAQPDFAILSDLNVTEVISCEPLSIPGLELIMQRQRFFLYRNTRAAGRVSVHCETDARADRVGPVCDRDAQVEILSADTPTGRLRFRVSLPEPRVLVLSEPYYPERRAWVDGVETPMEKVKVVLSAVPVAAGIHVVELKFVPTTLYWGALISFGVVAAWVVSAARR